MGRNDTMMQYFEWYCNADGTHWKRFEHEAQQLLDAGITMAWLPPAYKGTRGSKSEGYDVYDIYDLGEFNQKETVRTKYGTKEEYVQAINKARQLGLKVCVDVVLNHMGGAEKTERFQVRKVDPDDREQFISEPMEIEAYTRFEFPGRAGRHSGFQWDYRCFTGIDHAVGKDEPAIYTIQNEYGDKWEPLTHNEKGNFDYLILNDIETRNPAVREELKKWISWYYQTVAFDGVRLDAVKHMNPSFFIEWLKYIREEINPQLFVVGEYWLSDDLPVLLNYIRVTDGIMSLFDAPLHHNLSEASKLGVRYDLRNIFKDTLVSVYPDLAVTFVDNHDTQPLQSLEEYTEQWFKPHAYALILLREQGFPCVFYADYYGASYCDSKKPGSKVDVTIPKLSILPLLLRVRKDLAYGEQHDYLDQADCIGWTRSGSEDMPHSGCAVLLTNAQRICRKRMFIGTAHSGRKMVNQTDVVPDEVIIDEEGYGSFYVMPSGLSVYTFESAG